ncbi:extensin [Arsenicitalea aurantiaca]|uniref:Extensin n=1 Tax=Arsenicitalea aurantiaca TaxID=1783274 RepID=A0A433X8K2_9HYPH|nr:extensin family protein [Arsenicitalea aurantiaca]RUT30368.1 extensin [Arsenicitalea aurantiaca]
MRPIIVLLALAIAFPGFAQEEAPPPLPRDRPETVIEEPIEAVEEAEETGESDDEDVEDDQVRETEGDEPLETEDATDDLPPLPRPVPQDEPVAEPADEPVDDAVADVPDRVYQAACPAVLMGLVEAEMLPPIEDEACGERSPLSVTGVLANGRMVPLSGAVTLNCAMAGALPGWIAEIDGYAQARENSSIASVRVGTSYFCRNRNNASSGFLSEHGFANALDVTGFELEDGRSIALPDGWEEPLSSEGRLLRFAHSAACARFTTTLGPEANALHEDHFHLDMGCHGRTCTARLCE